jgi:hypothetical protein
MTTCTWKLEAYLSAAWVDISADVLTNNPVKWSWGLSGDTFFDRTSRTGYMTVGLRNSTGAYSPGHAGATGGWQLGSPVKLTLTYDGVAHAYRYYVNSINIVPGEFSERSVSVSLVDWMDYPSRYLMTLTPLELYKRADEGLTSLLSALPVAPQSTDFEAGVNTFVSIFDTIKDNTRAMSEISKLINSELGYCVLRKDKTNGETLVFENYLHRNGLQELSNIPSPSSDVFDLLQENGDHLLQENNSLLLLDSAFHVSSESTMNSALIEYGKNIVNFMEAKTTPRHVDTTAITLFTLRQPVKIGSGQTITLKGKYTEPTSGRPINADPSTMITPSSSDGDYEAWSDYTGSGLSAKPGSGTEFTASLSITTDFGSDSFSHSIRNNSLNSGHITKFIQRGYGLYTWDELSYQESSSDSETSYGHSPKSLMQEYMNDISYGTLAAASIVESEKEPRTVLKKVTFKSITEELMLSFLNLDVGSIIEVKENMGAVDGYYYIQSIDAQMSPSSVASNALVEWTWSLRQLYKVGKGLSLYTVQLTSDSENLAIDFGYIPELCNQENRSISAWIYPTADASSDSTDPSRVIVANYSDASGYDFVLKNELKLGYNQAQTTSDPAAFETSTDAVTLNAWNHIVVTRNANNFTASPLFYVNNVNKVTTTVTAQSTASPVDTGSHTFIGNIKTATWDYTGSFLGKIANVRIYNNYSLTTDDINDLYAAGVTDYQTCIRPELSFMAPAVYTDRLSDYIGGGITPGKNVIDAVRYYVGKPSATAPVSGGTYINQPDETDGIDTYINENAGTSNYGANAVISVGDNSVLDPTKTRRGLLKFDLTLGTSPPPSSATVLAAKIYLTVTASLSGSPLAYGRPFTGHRLLRNWSESQATWEVYTTGNNWGTEGASAATDRSSSISCSFQAPVGTTVGDVLVADIDLSLVQGWVDGSISNYGLLIIDSDEHSGELGLSFGSANESTVSKRPKIEISYV